MEEHHVLHEGADAVLVDRAVIDVKDKRLVPEAVGVGKDLTDEVDLREDLGAIQRTYRFGTPSRMYRRRIELRERRRCGQHAKTASVPSSYPNTELDP